MRQFAAANWMTDRDRNNIRIALESPDLTPDARSKLVQQLVCPHPIDQIESAGGVAYFIETCKQCGFETLV